MHQGFKLKGGQASPETYTSVLTKQRISIGFPLQDECQACEIFKAHKEGNSTGIAKECDICFKHDAHIKRA